ncbi:MAG: 3'(2'),5'-bisphosphate nucleotidase CysQ [Draconibacterium sp.]|nr:3'(2'),5'-bisphosphate nucleotidase CysQ [Draconibacterium sp.]
MIQVEKEHIQFIFNILAEAGNAIVNVYESDSFGAELKSDNSPVTKADKASSNIINKDLKKIFPDIPVLDEEHVIPDFNIRTSWPQYFLVDPLDGTKEFIKRNGEFCINLALMRGDSPEQGWIYEPLKKTGWYCKKGEGIFEFDDIGNLKKINRPELHTETIRIVASRSFFKPREAELIEKIKQSYTVEILHSGSSKKQVQMVLGNADMYLKAGPCSEWDTAPGQLMVEEFGGAVLRHDNFETMRYNKEDLINPHFVMLNSHYNTPDFISYLKNIIQN